jgi:hypothetical protein
MNVQGNHTTAALLRGQEYRLAAAICALPSNEADLAAQVCAALCGVRCTTGTYSGGIAAVNHEPVLTSSVRRCTQQATQFDVPNQSTECSIVGVCIAEVVNDTGTFMLS